MSLDRDKPPGACGSRVPDGFAPRCTTRRHKTHNTVVSEVLYPWHPWHGREVQVIEGMTRSDRAVFRCRLDPDESGRTLELPQWMLDRATCCRMQLAAHPTVRVDELRSLQRLLELLRRGEASNAIEDRHDPFPLKGDADVHATEDCTLPSTASVPTSAGDSPCRGA